MTRPHRTHRLRVAAPTLEPDPVFLGVLAGLGAHSRPAGPRTTRTAALRVFVAMASTAAIAIATWAAGTSGGGQPPLAPTASPIQQDATGLPSPGDVGTPQSDRPTSPGSLGPPRLPGTGSFDTGQATDPTGRPAPQTPAPRSENAPGRMRAEKVAPLVPRRTTTIPGAGKRDRWGQPSGGTKHDWPERGARDDRDRTDRSNKGSDRSSKGSDRSGRGDLFDRGGRDRTDRRDQRNGRDRDDHSGHGRDDRGRDDRGRDDRGRDDRGRGNGR